MQDISADSFGNGRHSPRIDAKCGEHFLQADLSLLISVCWHQITSGLPTIHPEAGPDAGRRSWATAWSCGRPPSSRSKERFRLTLLSVVLYSFLFD